MAPLAAVCGVCRVLRAPISPAGVIVGMLLARRRYQSSDARREALARDAAIANVMEELDARRVKALLGHVPAWVTFPTFERCKWLNAALEAAWPSANSAVSELVFGILSDVFKKLDIPTVNELVLRRFTLGSVAPKLGGVSVARVTDEQAVLDVEFKWGGNPDVELAIKLMGGVAAIPVRLAQLQVFGTIRLVLDFAPRMPVISALSVSTIGKPRAKFTLQVLGGDVMNLPGLESTVDNIINNVLTGLIKFPRRIFVPLQPGVTEDGIKPGGILYVRVLSAANLPRMDVLSTNGRIGSADPYTKLWVRDDRVVRLLDGNSISRTGALEIERRHPMMTRLVV